jgi:ATP-dependent Lon protease
MVYIGDWVSDYYYKKGDTVYVPSHFKYFVCAIGHQSSVSSHPCRESSQWIGLCNHFLNEICKDNSLFLLTKEFRFNAKRLTHDDESNSSDEQELEVEKIRKALLENHGRARLKRKLDAAEQELETHKRRKLENGDEMMDLREKLMLMKIDLDTKTYVLDKYDHMMRMSGTEFSKQMGWLKLVSSIPFGKYRQLQVSHKDPQDKLKDFFDRVKTTLDASIYGLDNVKEEILEFVGRKITNPDGKGHVLALCGNPGVGKTKIIKCLAQALDLPFFQINCGGLNDASVLVGHSETYVGSKPGKLVELLANARCMNPIIYLDEVDKIGESKSREINGILTHLLDEEQNDRFQDNYLSNINLDFSKAFFVLSFNDPSKVDTIVFDRMKVIYINAPTVIEKVRICQDKMIPDIINGIKFKNGRKVSMDTNLIEYIILQKSPPEEGVRQLRKTLEKLMTRLNFDILTGRSNLVVEDDAVVITRTYIDKVLVSSKDDHTYLAMYS